MSENKTVWHVGIEKTIKKELTFEVVANTREEAIEKTHALLDEDGMAIQVVFCYNKGERV